MRVFWQHGYEGSSIELLRSAMGGISSASFYAAYRSKEELYREAVERYLGSHGQVMASLVDPDLAPREQVERALRSSARMQSELDHPLGCMITLSATICSPQGEAVSQSVAKHRHASRAAIHDAVRRAINEGSLRLDAADAGLASLLDLALNGMSVVARDGVGAQALDQAVDTAMMLWDSYADQ